MPKVNRNDPCPCGSGKKYKHCCLARDRLSVSRRLNLLPDEGYLLNQLYDYASTARFSADLDAALAIFWGSSDAADAFSECDPDDMRRTMEWFALDYPTSDSRRPLVEVFIESIEKGHRDLPREVLPTLHAWRESVGGVYRLLAVDGAKLALHDCLRETSLEAVDASLARNARVGDLLLGRLLTQEGNNRFSLMTTLLPAAYEEELVTYVRHAFKLYQSSHYGATWTAFMRENGHLCNAFMLSPQAQYKRALIGPGTRFHDPAVSRDKLLIFAKEREVEAMRAEQEEEERVADEHRTTSGIILPGPALEPPPSKPAPGAPNKPAPAPTILIPGRDF